LIARSGNVKGRTKWEWRDFDTPADQEYNTQPGVVNPDRKKLKDNADRLLKTWIAKCHGRDGTGQR